jgi:hypothetical protein
VAVVLVVGLGLGLGLGLSSNTTTAGSTTKPRTNLQSVELSLTQTNQIYQSFEAQRQACKATACIENAAGNALSSEGAAANLFNTDYFPSSARGAGQSYVSALITLQNDYKSIAVSDSGLSALGKDVASARTLGADAEAALS